jgi:Flp pilus assembly protein TadG
MKHLLDRTNALLRDRKGVTALEYGIIAGVLGLVLRASAARSLPCSPPSATASRATVRVPPSPTAHPPQLDL